MRRSVAVTIAGQRFALKSDADDAYVHLLAGFVDDKIREAQGKAPGKPVAVHQAAVLAALQIADELLRERRSRSELRRKVKVQARRLLEELGGDPSTRSAASSSDPVPPGATNAGT